MVKIYNYHLIKRFSKYFLMQIQSRCNKLGKCKILRYNFLNQILKPVILINKFLLF